MTVLEVRDLKKSYGKVEAVRGTSFEVRKGQCFGLLGPNGAGKSTTIELIENIIQPDSGEILFAGQPLDSKFRDRLGVQFQETALPPSLTVRETLETFSNLYSRSLPLETLIPLCQLQEFQNQKTHQISGGQRQRLFLALALCNDPELLLLDEPTTGLDPQARRHLWNIVNQVKKEGKTLILTTHYMDEAYELCDEIAIMDHGQIIARGSPSQLLSEHFRTVVVQLPQGSAAEAISQVQAQWSIHSQGPFVEIHTEDLNGTLKTLGELELDLRGMNIRQSNLEDLFLKLTGQEIRS